MRVLMIVPARANNCRVPHKNKMLFAGKPSILWTLEALQDCQWVDAIVVVSDDREIRGIACRNGATALREPGHVAKSEDLYDVADYVCRHVKDKYDAIGFAYPNVPVRPPKLFDLLCDTFIAEEVDSVAAVCEDHSGCGGSIFSWKIMQRIIADRSVIETYDFAFLEFSHNELVEIDTPEDVQWAKKLLSASATRSAYCN